MSEYHFDTQALVEGCLLSEIQLRKQITDHFVRNSLTVGGDNELMKIHFHTNHPGKLIDYLANWGDIFDVVIENMDRQSRGEKG
ncbi:kinase to dihydroxyacetone kinase [Limosilactobacillus sp. STM2_1]|uniref:Kinase to dihydroxyacetone kinase n=1 Tax=Limosilactobacillus rudii TaxID=2759755 RepID=A0A7W3UL66_9LACO|nr:kinase to dihydroxyacetone kinase [Limosilactobacillus rudii]MBB1079556.1 kinase to dihydroxyacetone kinase [Limosilactobacillus rudii]MBB1097602.1 kinase to dihydroxyacetone kinase [Limosilactobacillus rudii]MCD7134711.1 kinase to dihydroxyacetone kinase [Limosilactobacillus rudii]